MIVQQQPETIAPAQEFSPKIFLLQVRDSARYLRSKLWVIIVTGLLLGVIGIVIAFTKKPLYQAEITFALDEAVVGSPDAGGLSALSEELGFGNGLKAGGVFSSMANIVELIHSRLIIRNTLYRKVEVNGKQLVLADFFLDSLDLRGDWTTTPASARLFDSGKGKTIDSLAVNSLLSNIYARLDKKYLKIESKGKGTTLVSVTCTTENELFSKIFLEQLIDEVIAYYIRIRTERATRNLEFIAHRTDSIRQAYHAALNGRASFSDANINMIRETAALPREKGQTDIEILHGSYIELMRNMEAAKVILLHDTPLFQVLDTPLLPLQKNNASIIKNFIVGFLLGAVIAVLYFICRYVFSLILGSNEPEIEQWKEEPLEFPS